MAKQGRSFGADVDTEDKKKLTKSSLQRTVRVFRFVRPYRTQFILGFIFLILSTGTTLSFGKLIGEITSVVEGKSSFSLNQVVLFFVAVLIVQAVFILFSDLLFRTGQRTGHGRRAEIGVQQNHLVTRLFL